jgi:predicted NAD/FAD-dependent oxidoreductase
MSENLDVAILGAGLAGVSAARILKDAGRSVCLFDKSRGVGGRAATRRMDGQPVDHGAQFFTVRTEAFQKHVETWQADGVCREWKPSPWQWKAGTLSPGSDLHPRFCCPEGMTSLAKQDSREIETLRETTIVNARWEDGFWTLISKDERKFSARWVISTAPAPQTLAIFGDWISKEDPFRTVVYDPCITAIFRMKDHEEPWNAIQSDHPVIAWIANDSSRRGVGKEGSDSQTKSAVLVVHASADFSRTHLEEDPKSVVPALQQALVEMLGAGYEGLEVLHAHRWRYARVSNPLPGSCLPLAENLLFAGDAFLSANLEAAWLSGQAAALRIQNAES